MSTFDAACWRRVLEHMRRHHATICRQWFEQLEPLSLRGGRLTIATTTPGYRSYLQNHCREPFTEAAQQVTGALVSVEFVTTNGHAHATPHDPGVSSGIEAASPGDMPLTLMQCDDSDLEPAAAGQAQPCVSNGAPPRGTSAETMGLTAAPALALRPASGWDDADELLLSPDYRFETFVTGPNNNVAFSAAVAVANNPGRAYNPLFIHGGVGLGKTHLLQAICQRILESNPAARICFLSCETFRNQFLNCVQRGGEGMNEFRQRYRHVDVLVIDDIHFLANQDRTQEEFFHTFNALYQGNRQIVLSSDSAPAEIPQLEERLVSRFIWGLVQRVGKPSFETRVAIVRAKAELRGAMIPPDVVEYIAQRVDTNARELEGALNTIQGHAALTNNPITLELAREALADTTGAAPRQANLQQIIEPVTRYYNVKTAELQSKRRHKSITGPRQVCMWLARKRTRLSLEEIGGYFGGRDHTTVMHSIKIVDIRMEADERFAREVEQLDAAVAASL